MACTALKGNVYWLDSELANTRCFPSVVSMLCHRRRRWHSIETTLWERLVCHHRVQHTIWHKRGGRGGSGRNSRIACSSNHGRLIPPPLSRDALSLIRRSDTFPLGRTFLSPAPHLLTTKILNISLHNLVVIVGWISKWSFRPTI